MTEVNTGVSQKILFVDDEILLLEGIKRQLRREFNIHTAEGPQAGLELLAAEGPFAVVVSDFNMPGMDGVAFLKEVHLRHPETVLVMLTGRTDLDIAVNALHNAHISRFLNKPCQKEILLETLGDALEQYRLRVSEILLQQQLQASNQKLFELNVHLEALVAAKTQSLQIQYRYAAQMTMLPDGEGIVGNLIGVLAELTGLPHIRLWLCPLLDRQFICHYPKAEGLPAFDSGFCPAGLIADALQHKQIRYFDNQPAETLTDFDRSLLGGAPLLLAPLLHNNDVLGLLTLANDKPKRLADDVREAIGSVVDVTATALLSHWRREAQMDAEDAIIAALAKLSEYRDPETGAHLERLKRYCQLICEYLGQTEKFRERVTPAFTRDLVRSSPLHDIGKVGIEDAILKKPGKLTPEEFEIMKTHATIGGDTLRSVYEQYPTQDFIKCGMDVAYGHHERWDGSGYPLGLHGEQIPLAARILALVDVYDALTSRRVYKPAFPREQANKIIFDGKGSHFDPDIVAAFAELETQFHRIAVELADVLEA